MRPTSLPTVLRPVRIRGAAHISTVRARPIHRQARTYSYECRTAWASGRRGHRVEVHEDRRPARPELEHRQRPADRAAGGRAEQEGAARARHAVGGDVEEVELGKDL